MASIGMKAWLYIIGLLLFFNGFALLFGTSVLAVCSEEASVDEMRSLPNRTDYPRYDDGIDGPYVDNGNGIVTDLGTDLMWQQAPPPWEAPWSDACQYCEDLELGGYTDWQLPTVRQLISILNSNYNYGINEDFFSGSGLFWSGTTVINQYYDEQAWGVFFFGDSSGFFVKSKANYNIEYVRCVRQTTQIKTDIITTVLTSNSSSLTLTADFTSVVYGTNTADNVVVEQRAMAKLMNFQGNNSIEFKSNAATFSIKRSGAVVKFESTDGTILEVPATIDQQILTFPEGILTLYIDAGISAIVLEGNGTQVVTTDLQYIDVGLFD